MELGQKIKQARLELGLSQRALCGDTITRNMLSQIENGTARPSMDTLRTLAQRLGKPMGYFLEEVSASANQPLMEQARSAFAAGEFSVVLELMSQYIAPDPVFNQEAGLLRMLCRMELAEQAIAQGRQVYALQLLEQVQSDSSVYFESALRRRFLLDLAQAKQGREVALPIDDRELLLRAKAALDAGAPERAGQYLDAAEDTASPGWSYLRGLAYMGQKAYEPAKACLQRSQDAYAGPAVEALEICCRELGDFEGAYRYACLGRELEG